MWIVNLALPRTYTFVVPGLLIHLIGALAALIEPVFVSVSPKSQIQTRRATVFTVQ